MHKSDPTPARVLVKNMTLEKVKHTRPIHPSMQGDSTQKQSLTAIDGWETFTEDEKNFLLVYQVTGVQTVAARIIGKKQSWISTRTKKKFKKLLETPLGKIDAINLFSAKDVIARTLIQSKFAMAEPQNAPDIDIALKAGNFALKVLNHYEKEFRGANNVTQTVNVLTPQKPSWTESKKGDVIDHD